MISLNVRDLRNRGERHYLLANKNFMRQFNHLYSYHVIYREVGAWNRGYWFEFESKMASASNVVFMDYRTRDVVFMISLTHKVTQQPSSSPFLPLSCCLVLISLAVLPLPSQAIHI